MSHDIASRLNLYLNLILTMKNTHTNVLIFINTNQMFEACFNKNFVNNRG